MRTALVPKWLPKSVWLRGLLTILAARKLTAVVRRGRGRVSSAQRAKAVNELKKLVPPPRPRALGGERIGTHTYERFLSVVEWKPERAAPLLEADLVWRARVQPRACRPQDLPNACSQSGWQVLMVSTKASPAPPPASPAQTAPCQLARLEHRQAGRRWVMAVCARLCQIHRRELGCPFHRPHAWRARRTPHF